MGASEEEVVRDESGREYIVVIHEIGAPGCDYEVREVKKFLPEELSE